MADEALVHDVIREVGRRARGERAEGLGHPVAVSAKLDRHLGIAQGNAALVADTRALRAAGRVLDPVLDEQRVFNASVVEVLHQLDHRTRAQADEIVALQAEVSRLQARLQARS